MIPYAHTKKAIENTAKAKYRDESVRAFRLGMKKEIKQG